jgi:ABC-type multidrug transport system ATPase subunit
LCQQNDFLFEDLTAEEHLTLICRLRCITDEKEIEEQITERVSDVCLELEHLKKRVKHLSPGARRKLSIAMSLIGEGKLLILDEPTANLDLRSRENIWKMIKNLAKKGDISILVSTQHIEEADFMGTRVCVLKNGKMVECDTPENLKRHFGTGFKVKMLAN